MKISRRTVLRGLGTAIALPWLEAMAPLSSLAASLPGSSRAGAASNDPIGPVRMAFFYVPNGIHMPDWKPPLTEAEFALPYILEPLNDHRDKINLYTGLSLKNAESLGSGPGDHARSNAAFLTGAHPKKTNGANLKNGISIDQLAAQHIGDQTRLRSLELGIEASATSGECDSGYSCAYSSNLSWRNESSPLPKEINPRVVFERIFGTADGPDSRKNLAQRERRRKSILDFSMNEAKSLNQKLGTNDRRKLDEYLYAVREIERRLKSTEKLDQVETDISNFVRPAGVPRAYDEHVRLLMDMLVLAFQTDSTRIATFSFGNEGSNRAYRDLSINEGHHEISHHGGAKEKQMMIRKINRFHMELFQHFVSRLSQIKEGEKSLLDNSMILYGSGISDGNRHDHSDLPIMTVGSAGGHFKTGRVIRNRDKTPLTNLYSSMLGFMNIKIDEFADSNGTIKDL